MNSFTEHDYFLAKEALNTWHNKTDETVDGLILRKRKAELRQLVRSVIKNELTHEQQLLVKLHWYDGMSQSDIALRLGLERSTVSRKMRKINEIIYDKLKYAMEFRFGKCFADESKLIITSNEAVCSNLNPTEISGRLKTLRIQQCFTLSDVSRLSGIEEERLQKIEKKGSIMTVTELKKLAVLYRVTSDFLLFGTNTQLH
ncbi:MAG: hypothetical protein IJ491_07640 [Clostridia bacterium]|nr:hypothetical protein [Clostridia bacterium]